MDFDFKAKSLISTIPAGQTCVDKVVTGFETMNSVFFTYIYFVVTEYQVCQTVEVSPECNSYRPAHVKDPRTEEEICSGRNL